MKNHNEMYQSLLSRYEEHQEKKKKRILTLKRTVPALACFCFCAVLGIGYWNHFQKLPNIPVKPDVIEEPTIEVPATTTSMVTESKTTTQVSDKIESASTTAPTSNSETERMTTTAGIQTVTTIATDETEIPVGTDMTEMPTTESVIKQTETQTSATTSFVYCVETEWGYVPPLGFQNQSEMIDAIHSDSVSVNNDGGGFNGNLGDYETAKKAYLDMYARFRDEGFYLQAASTDDVTVRDDVNLYLFPFTPYEDAGIGRSTIFRETGFFVVFYRADPDLTAYTTDIADYLRLRKECGTDRIIQIQDQTISIYRGTDGQLHAAAFADADHYYEVRTMATEEELTEFLSHLSYERINL